MDIQALEIAIRCGHTVAGVHPNSQVFDWPDEAICLDGCNTMGIITEANMGRWMIDATGSLVSLLETEGA